MQREVHIEKLLIYSLLRMFLIYKLDFYRNMTKKVCDKVVFLH